MWHSKVFSEYWSEYSAGADWTKGGLQKYHLVDQKDFGFFPKYGRDGAQFASIQTGIPIGNLTSQFFANIYLNGLDHFIKKRLGCRYYLRYMDDFVIFHDDKDFLWKAKVEIQKYLWTLRLSIHENKCRIFKTRDGTPFLGLLISRDRRRIRRSNLLRFKRRLRRFQIFYGKGIIAWKHLHQSIQSWIGHAKHADTRRLRELIFSEVVFRKGS